MRPPKRTVTSSADSHATSGAPRSASIAGKDRRHRHGCVVGALASRRGREPRRHACDEGVAQPIRDLDEAAGEEEQQQRGGPTDDTSSGAAAKSGNSVGRPMTHAAPSNGPTIEPRPPMTPIATSVTDSVVANVAFGVFAGSDVT